MMVDAQTALDECRRLYDGGDPFALFEAIRICFARQMAAPEWIVDAFTGATDRWYALDATSLDEAFGVAYQKGTNFNALKKRRSLTLAVYRKVTEASKQGRSIDDGLFEDVGVALGLGRTQVKNYYREARTALKNPVAAQMLMATWALHELKAYPPLRREK